MRVFIYKIYKISDFYIFGRGGGGNYDRAKKAIDPLPMHFDDRKLPEKSNMWVSWWQYRYLY